MIPVTEPATDFGDLTEAAHLLSRARDRFDTANPVSTDPTTAMIEVFGEGLDLVGVYNTLTTAADLADGAMLDVDQYNLYLFANPQAVIAVPLGAFSQEFDDTGPYWAEWDAEEVGDYHRALRILYAFNEVLIAETFLDLIDKASGVARASGSHMAGFWALHVPDLLTTARDAARPDDKAAIDLLVGLGGFEQKKTPLDPNADT